MPFRQASPGVSPPEAVKVMSAHCGCVSTVDGFKLGATHIVETTTVVGVRDDLYSGVGTSFDAEVAGNGDGLPAEITGSHFRDGRPENGVKGVAGLVADREEDGDGVFGVPELHVEAERV